MARVEHWNPTVADELFENVAIERLAEAAEVVAQEARRRCPVGTISRPMYKRGPYADQPWTARDAGALKKTLRVTLRRTKTGKPLARRRNVRVYAGPKPGTDTAWYARIVEFYTPYLRPALLSMIPRIKTIIGAK